MSKSSSRSRPSESVFGALGPDDAYFGNRVQAAARDAQQRWPLLGGLAPSAAEEAPALTDGDKSRWQPQAPLTPKKPEIARPSLSKKLESGLSRLASQTSAESRPNAQQRRAEPGPREPHETSLPVATRAVRTAPTEPAPLSVEPVSKPVGARSSRSDRAERTAPKAPASLPSRSDAPVPAADKSLGSLFRRLQNQEPQDLPAATDATRKSILGRLGKR